MSDIIFSGVHIDRQSTLRSDPVALATARANPATRYVAIWHGRCLVNKTRVALLTADNISAYAENQEHCTFLGKYDEGYIFTLAIETPDAPDFGTYLQFIGLREISTRLDASHASLAAYARAIIAWQNNHQHCGICGAPNNTTEGGFVMACSDSACGHRSFPRLDPAVIVLVHHNDHALLGRQTNWPERRFSTIAGFVEPGESLEDAVCREVAEETNIKVGAATYIASQPWPFPAALMIGFQAQGMSTDIKLNDGELAEARWVSRQEIASGDIILSPKISVAYHLIETWFNQYDGPTLTELNLPEVPFQVPRPIDTVAAEQDNKDLN
jgi:NAD+ diphosphatase